MERCKCAGNITQQKPGWPHSCQTTETWDTGCDRDTEAHRTETTGVGSPRRRVCSEQQGFRAHEATCAELGGEARPAESSAPPSGTARRTGQHWAWLSAELLVT